MGILFKNAAVLTKKDGKYVTLENAYLGVEGKYIDYIGVKKPKKKYEVEKDYRKKILVPGLINSHTHIPMVFIRGFGIGHTLQEWLYDFIFPIEAKMTAKQIKWASYYALLEMISSGTTSFTDMYFFSEETVKAVADAGVKANLNKYINCFDENQKIEDSLIPASVEFFKKYNGMADGRIIADFSIHSEYTCKPHIVKEYSRLCKENGARMHLHLSETKKEHEECIERYGMTPAEWFESMGTFDNPTTAAHCVWISNSDRKILKNHDVTVVHNPTSNLLLGNGFAPIRGLRREGINIALGTDGAASNNNLNMIEEMHIATIASDGYHLDPTYLNGSDVIDMATINGAKGQGREDTGILEVGKCADIIALDLDRIYTYPIFDYTVMLTSEAQASDVCLNMVDGKILYEDGEFLTLDKDKIIRNFKREVEGFFKEEGIRK